MGRKKTEDAWEQGGEENIQASEGGSKTRHEKIAEKKT